MPKIRRRGRTFWAQLVDEFEAAGAVEAHGEFAGRQGVDRETFRRWLYLLRAERRGRRWSARDRERAGRAAPAISLPLLEVASARVDDDRFEIDLGAGRRLRVPATFDAEALRRLLAVLQERAG